MRTDATHRPRLFGVPLKTFGFVIAAIMTTTPVWSGVDARAADYAVRSNSAGDVVLTLSGPITSMDGAIFLEQVNRHRPRIVAIEGPGGDMLSAVRIGVIVHERHLWTHATGPCRSACAYIWIAGRHMLAEEGVEISNHLPQSLLAEHPDQRGIALFGWYLGKLDISVAMMDAFLDKATDRGTVPNQYFDMLAFAEYWNAPVEVLPVPASSFAGTAD